MSLLYIIVLVRILVIISQFQLIYIINKSRNSNYSMEDFLSSLDRFVGQEDGKLQSLLVDFEIHHIITRLLLGEFYVGMVISILWVYSSNINKLR